MSESSCRYDEVSRAARVTGVRTVSSHRHRLALCLGSEPDRTGVPDRTGAVQEAKRALAKGALAKLSEAELKRARLQVS